MTLQEINAKIAKLDKLRWKAVRYASAYRANGNFKLYWSFSAKAAVLEQMLKNAFSERLPLLQKNQEQHEKTPVGQFLKNSKGMHGQDILMKHLRN